MRESERNTDHEPSVAIASPRGKADTVSPRVPPPLRRLYTAPRGGATSGVYASVDAERVVIRMGQTVIRNDVE
jgi:hypothetical protein